MGAVPKRETIRHLQAFEHFYWQGDGRTTRAVARQFKISEQSISVWATAFHWRDRVEQREQRVADAVRGKGDAEALKIREDQIKIGRAVIAKFAARLGNEADRIRLDVSKYEPNAVDAARWAQHLLLLTGQATSRTELNLGAGTVDALVSGVVAVLRKHLDPDLQAKVSAEILEYAKSLTAAGEAHA